MYYIKFVLELCLMDLHSLYIYITWWWIWSLYYIDSFDDYDDDFVDNGFHQLNQQHISNEV